MVKKELAYLDAVNNRCSISDHSNDCVHCKAVSASCEYIHALEAENAEQKAALTRIDTWAKAYPLDIFPKPDLKRAAEVLKASGMTLDSISADNMRHVLDGIKDIVSETLKGNTDV